MSDTYLLNLCREYLDICALMTSGEYDGDEYRRLSADRALLHDELIRMTGHERPFDMKQFARETVAANLIS